MEFFNYSSGMVMVLCVGVDVFVFNGSVNFISLFFGFGDMLVFEFLGVLVVWYVLGGLV